MINGQILSTHDCMGFRPMGYVCNMVIYYLLILFDRYMLIIANNFIVVCLMNIGSYVWM